MTPPRPLVVAMLLFVVSALLVLTAVPALALRIELVSISSTGVQADHGWTNGAAVSADGRFVAFGSEAITLVPGDTNGATDIFVRDRQAGTTERVSVGTMGEQANGPSNGPLAISADGHLVGFRSEASNLVAGDTNGTTDVFVRDRHAGITERVSVSSTGEEGDGPSDTAAMSADGRFVAFVSSATNLVAGDSNGTADIFVHDRQTGATERVSVSDTGEEANGASGSWQVDISADGRFVAFWSEATNLMPGDTNGGRGYFVHDRQTGATERVSGPGFYLSGGTLGLSADGRFVAFGSDAVGVVPGDTNNAVDVFVYDRQTGTTERVSVSSAGEQVGGDSWLPDISADGRYVTFTSVAVDLAPGDTTIGRDVFVHDRQTGITGLISAGSAGVAGNGCSACSGISANGRYVAFPSNASDLVSGDINGAMDVFAADLAGSGFWDVPWDFWAYDEIMACFNAGIVQGYDDGLYHPEYSVTRDQMAVYIGRALATPSGDASVPPGPETATFEDVPNTGYGESGTDPYWAYRYIEYCVDQGVVQGYDADTYAPTAVVTRDQMAVFVARAKGWVHVGDDMTAAPEVFPDVAAGYWSGSAVKACVDNGVVQGYDDGKYHPEYEVTRDQMAVYIQRAFQLPM